MPLAFTKKFWYINGNKLSRRNLGAIQYLRIQVKVVRGLVNCLRL